MDSGYISSTASTLQTSKAAKSTSSDFQSKNTLMNPFSFTKMSFDLQAQKTLVPALKKKKLYR